MLYLCDVDGVVADFAGAAVKVIRTFDKYKDFGDNKNDLGDWYFIPEDIYSYVVDKMNCSEFEMFIKSYDAIKLLQSKGDLLFVTAPGHHKEWCNDRTYWLMRKFGVSRKDIIFAHKKQYVIGDYLIDDRQSNLLSWKKLQNKSKENCILVNQFSNQKNRTDDYVIVNSLWDFATAQ